MDVPVSANLGNRIKQMRIAKGLTQERMAERIGKSIGLIGQIERSETMPSVETLLDIINALDSSADAVLCDFISSGNQVLREILSEVGAFMPDQQEYILDLVKRFGTYLHAGQKGV